MIKSSVNLCVLGVSVLKKKQQNEIFFVLLQHIKINIAPHFIKNSMIIAPNNFKNPIWDFGLTEKK